MVKDLGPGDPGGVNQQFPSHLGSHRARDELTGPVQFVSFDGVGQRHRPALLAARSGGDERVLPGLRGAPRQRRIVVLALPVPWARIQAASTPSGVPDERVSLPARAAR